MVEWKTLLRDGEKFLNIAISGTDKNKKFTPEIICNVLIMSIENFFMAYLVFKNLKPLSRTLSVLMSTLKSDLAVDSKLESDILKLKKYQDISCEENSVLHIDTIEVLNFIEVGKSFSDLIRGNLLRCKKEQNAPW